MITITSPRTGKLIPTHLFLAKMLEGSMSVVVDLHDKHSKPYMQSLFCVCSGGQGSQNNHGRYWNVQGLYDLDIAVSQNTSIWRCVLKLILFNSWHFNVCLEIKPFHLYHLEEEDAHLCPVQVLSDWINAAEITDGYVSRKIGSGERLVEINTPMVSDFLFFCVKRTQIFARHQNSSLSYSETTFFLT